MELVRSLNLGVRFMLEIAALGAVGAWGFQVERGAAAKWLLGLGAPLLIIVVWAMVVAPGTENGLSATTKMWIGTTILGAAAVAVAAAGRPALAAVFATAILLNALLLQTWEH